jgi:hypothetical protein
VAGLLQLTFSVCGLHELFKSFVVSETHLVVGFVEISGYFKSTLNFLNLDVGRAILAVEGSDYLVEFLCLIKGQQFVIVCISGGESVLPSLCGSLGHIRVRRIVFLSGRIEDFLVRRGLLIPVRLEGPLGRLIERNSGSACGSAIIVLLET